MNKLQSCNFHKLSANSTVSVDIWYEKISEFSKNR